MLKYPHTQAIKMREKEPGFALQNITEVRVCKTQ